MMKKKVMVLGLGVFGISIAKTLAEYDQDVLGVDKNKETIAKASEMNINCVCGDFADNSTLLTLHVKNYDVVVIAESTNLETSLLTLNLLKTQGVKYIIAKAKNNTQKEMLYTLGANLVVKPETEVAERLAKNISNNNLGDIIEIDDEYSIVEKPILQCWANHSIKQLDLRKNYGINVIGYKNANDSSFTLKIDPNLPLQVNDVLLILIKKEKLNKLSYLK